MTTFLDTSIDRLSDAPLTPEQRQVWDQLRAEHLSMAKRIRELENHLENSTAFASDNQSMVLSRPEFNREVARMLAFDERYGGTSSILYFDFENLHLVEAKFGRPAFEAAVREIGAIIAKNIRTSDIVGRLNGTEFGVLLTRCANTQAWRKGELLCTLLQEALQIVQGHPLKVDISYGAYTFRDSEDVTVGLREAAQVVTKARAG